MNYDADNDLGYNDNVPIHFVNKRDPRDIIPTHLPINRGRLTLNFGDEYIYV